MKVSTLAKEREITFAEIFDFTPEMIQRLFYFCQFCELFAVKDLWGPGRNYCPTCHKRPMSPAELIEGKYITCGNTIDPFTGQIIYENI